MRFKLAAVVLASALALSSTSAFAQGHHSSHHRGYNPYGGYSSLDTPRGYWNGPAGGPTAIAPGHGGYNSGWLDDSNLVGGSNGATGAP